MRACADRPELSNSFATLRERHINTFAANQVADALTIMIVPAELITFLATATLGHHVVCLYDRAM